MLPARVILVIDRGAACPIPILDTQRSQFGSELLHNPTMPPKKRPVLSVNEKERIAAQLLAASEGLISTAQAMKTAGLKTPERSETSKKRVYRKAQKIKCVGVDDGATTLASSGSASTPRQLVMEPNLNSQEQSVSSLSAPPSNSPSTTTAQTTTAEQETIRRQLDPPKRMRRTSKQKHQEQSEKNKRRKQQSMATKMATTQVQAAKLMDPSNPNKKSQIGIVADINRRMGTNVSYKSVSRMVRAGQIGISPSKPGPVGSFNKVEYDAMKVAFLSYIKLEQAIGKKQSTIKQLGFRVLLLH